MTTTREQRPLTRAELARRLGVSRTYVTLLCQGKKKPSKYMADRLAEMGLAANQLESWDGNPDALAGPLAQLVEHLTFNQGVTGSRPVRPTLNPLPLCRHFADIFFLNHFWQQRIDSFRCSLLQAGYRVGIYI